MRKLALLITLGLFMTVTVANACDGDKAAKGVKGKKATAACTKAAGMKNGKCTMSAAEMTKSGCCMHGASATAAKSGCCTKGATGAKHATAKTATETPSKS